MQAIQSGTQKAHTRRALLIVLLLALLAAGAFLYWRSQGQVTFQGMVRENITPLAATASGVVTRIETPMGQSARQGQVLLRLDDAPLRKALLEEQEKLQQLQQVLPPQHLRAPGQSAGNSAALAERLERQRQAEDVALRRFQETSDREAEAAILHNRVVLLSARKAATPEQREAAERSLNDARREKEEARKTFEALSLARAATGRELTRIRNEQAASGPASVAAETRLALYTRQQERVALAAAALEAALIIAPGNGVVATVLAQPGQRVEAGTPLLLFQPEGSAATVTADLPPEISNRLKQGQPCRIQGMSEKGEEISGYIESLGPAMPRGESKGEATPEGSREQAADLTHVRIALPPGPDNRENAPVRSDNTQVSVTVFLREPLYIVTAPAPVPPSGHAATGALSTDYTDAAPPASAGQAVPPAPPLSVQTPFGVLPPEQPAPQDASGMPPVPATLGGTPSAKGQTPPILPPMQAPYPLTGSPLPDPQNNPSVVPESILETPASAPR